MDRLLAGEVELDEEALFEIIDAYSGSIEVGEVTQEDIIYAAAECLRGFVGGDGLIPANEVQSCGTAGGYFRFVRRDSPSVVRD